MSDRETRQFEAQQYRADEAQATADEMAERFEAFFGDGTLITVVPDIKVPVQDTLLSDPEFVRRDFFGTDHVSGEETDSFATRSGRCYEMAALALVFRQVPVGSILVHGTIFHPFHSRVGRIGHAWLMLPGGLVWEPTFGYVYTQEVWQRWANPKVEKTYRAHTVMRLLGVTEHYGPWTASDRIASR